MLQDPSQHNGHKLVDIAQAIVDSHLLCYRRFREERASRGPQRLRWYRPNKAALLRATLNDASP